MSSNLAKVKADGGLLAVFEEQGTNLAEVAAAVSEAVGSGGMTMSDLVRIKLPTGGGLSFQVGDEEAKEVVGAIIADTEARAYWATPFGGGAQPPDCTSIDLRTGIGTPGGDCGTCPMAAYGSKTTEGGKPGRGQACAHRRMLTLFTPESALPCLLSAPPSSLKHLRQSFLRQAAGKGIRVSKALWSFTLTREKSGDNILFSVVKATLIRQLNAPEQALVDQYRAAVGSMETEITAEVMADDEQ